MTNGNFESLQPTPYFAEFRERLLQSAGGLFKEGLFDTTNINSFDEIDQALDWQFTKLEQLGPNELRILTLDLDGTLMRGAGIINPQIIKRLDELNHHPNMVLMALSSRHEPVNTVVKAISELHSGTDSITQLESIGIPVIIDSARQKVRANDEITQDDPLAEFSICLQAQINLKAAAQSLNPQNLIYHASLIADTARASALKDSDLPVWTNQTPLIRSELVSLLNIQNCMKNIGLNVEKFDLNFIEYKGALSRIGSALMKLTGRQLITETA